MVDLVSAFFSALVGMIITVVLSPIFSERVIQFYSDIGIFQPNMTVKASITENFYDEGVPVEKYDGIEWNSSYEVLRLQIQNEGDHPTFNINTSIFFPGFLEDYHISESGIHEVSLESADEKVEFFNHQDENVTNPCEANLYISQIDEGGQIVLEFIINTDTSSDGTYAHWNPSEEIEGSFYWEFRGVRLPEQFVEEIRDDIGVYDNIQPPENLKVVLDEYSSSGSNPDISLGVLDDPTDNPLYEEHQDDLNE